MGLGRLFSEPILVEGSTFNDIIKNKTPVKFRKFIEISNSQAKDVHLYSGRCRLEHIMGEHLRTTIGNLIACNEEWLMQRILHYAIERDYAEYTSTLVEPWRLSINGLSRPIISILKNSEADYELHPDEDYTKDAVAAFGILEAQRHRQRGISIGMFMGLFKYYRQSFIDLLAIHSFTGEERGQAENMLHRIFDRIELGLCSEWSSGTDLERIGELQAANRYMTNEKNKYLTLFESIHQPVFLLDEKGYFDRINQAAAEWIPESDNRFYSIDSSVDTINRSLHDKKYDDVFPWLGGITSKLSGDHRVLVEHKKVIWDNQTLEIDILCSAMQDVSEKFNGFVLAFSDRTAEYKLVSELQTMHVERLHASKLESIGQLAAGIAHEINTPSQYVSLNIEFIDEAFSGITAGLTALREAVREAPLSLAELDRMLDKMDWDYLREELPSAIAQSKDGMSRVTSIVQAMKEFSHPGEADFENVDINNLIRVTATVARNEWKYCAEMKLELDSTLPPVSAQSNEISQVFLNIIVNAAHSITERLDGSRDKGDMGQIRITTSWDVHSVVIQIADTGCGIPEDIRDNIFDPFFTTKTVGRGTGQGLAIVYDVITRKHGGRLQFESEMGKGTVFTIILPITQAPL